MNIRFYKIIVIVLSIAALALLANACEDDRRVPDWQWEDKKPEKKDTIPTPEPDPDTVIVNLKPRYIWIDACANFPDYANSKENITRDLTKVKNAGFTDIVVDVRPTMGDVLFSTTLVDQVSKLDYWDGPSYKFFERTADWDYLQAFLDEGHALGLKVHAAINTFIGGNKYPYGLGEQGMLFRDPSKKEWATTLNLESGLINEMDISDDSYGTKFLNPANPDVQAFVIGLLKDLAKYDLDGIILDRCRFDDLASDFSDYTIDKFEEYINETVTNVPGDIMAPGTSSYSLPYTLPKYFKRWLEFRVKITHDFIVDASSAVKTVNPKIKFGVYVGGWYSTYYDVGVNWASPNYNTSAKYYEWATVDYKNYGFADHLDQLLIGAYASANSVYGSTEWTTQGFCICADKVIMDAVPFAGGPDVGNWDTSGCRDVGKAVTNTVDACINSSDGYFVFDIIHVKMYDYWDELKAGIDLYLNNNK